MRWMMGRRFIIAGVVGVMLCGCGERKPAGDEKAARVVEKKRPISLVSSFRVKRTEAEERDVLLLMSDVVAWASESMVLASASNGRVQAFDVKSGEETWKAEFGLSVVKIACSARHVYVALHTFEPTYNREWLRRLTMSTGKDDTPPGIPQPGWATGMVWDAELERLCVVEDKKVALYTHDLMSVKKRIPVDGAPSYASTDGTTMLLRQLGGNCRVADVKAGTVEYIYGPPTAENSDSISRDDPMLVDAFYDASEGRLIRSVDTAKGKARLFIHESPGSAAREVETGMDHVRAAVHWPTQRLAVAGDGLVLFSTKGDVIEEVKDGAPKGAVAVEFSPSGKQLAVLDHEGWVRVYEMP